MVKFGTALFGIAMSLCNRREAPIKTTLSFQNLEAALPLGILQAADPVAREVLFIPELATIGSIPGANGRSHVRNREMWMRCETCWPRTILCVCPKAQVAADRRRSRFWTCGRPYLHVDPRPFRHCRQAKKKGSAQWVVHWPVLSVAEEENVQEVCAADRSKSRLPLMFALTRRGEEKEVAMTLDVKRRWV